MFNILPELIFCTQPNFVLNWFLHPNQLFHASDVWIPSFGNCNFPRKLSERKPCICLTSKIVEYRLRMIELFPSQLCNYIVLFFPFYLKLWGNTKVIRVYSFVRILSTYFPYKMSFFFPIIKAEKHGGLRHRPLFYLPPIIHVSLCTLSSFTQKYFSKGLLCCSRLSCLDACISHGNAGLSPGTFASDPASC